MKALAIIFVVITHNSIEITIRKSLLFPFWISMAVPIFIIISGTNYSGLIEKYSINSFIGWFKPRIFSSFLLRVVLPFLPIFYFEVMYRIINKNISYNLISLIEGFIKGGYGPGAYYICILFQFVLIFPVCYFIMQKNSFMGASLIISIQIIFEFIVHYYNISETVYSLLIFRYLIFIVGGIVIYSFNKNNKAIKWYYLLISFSVGFMYLFSTNYLVYNNTLFTYWPNTALPSAFYIFPIVYLVTKIKITEAKNIMDKYISIIGQASFHIYLIQKIYYKYFCLFNNVGIILLLCINIGIAYYCIDAKLARPFFNKILSKPSISQNQ